MKIAVVANSAWYLYNFRSRLLRRLIEEGHRPIAVSPKDGYERRLLELGVEHIALPLRAAGTNPFQELDTVRRLRQLLSSQQFDLAFTYTPKLNIYTGLARMGLATRHVPNISGLGAVFSRPSRLRSLVTLLYKVSLRNAHTVVFQNEDDRALFVQNNLVRQSRTIRVPGSGVDLSHFQPAPRLTQKATSFLFVGRILKDKGVLEYVQAARELKREHPHLTFQILGPLASENPAAIQAETVRDWQSQGWIAYLGAAEDVRPFILACDCVVLPSYREGVPRVLLEGSAMARPCITTTAPGCKDVVDDGKTGFLCAAGDAKDLENAIRRFLGQSNAERLKMGQAARAKVEREFSESIVLDTYIGLTRQIELRTTHDIAAKCDQ